MKEESTEALESPVAKTADPAELGHGSPTELDSIADKELIIVPVRNMVLFPGVILPLMIGREQSVLAIQEAVRTQSRIGVLLQRDEAVEEPTRSDLYNVGTVAEVARYLTDAEGRHHAVCQGEERFRVLSMDDSGSVLRAKVEPVGGDDPEDQETEARFIALKQQAQEVLRLSPGAPEELSNALQAITSSGMLADMSAAFMDIPPAEKQEILETLAVADRVERISVKLGHLAAVLELSNKIREETQGSMSKAQREYYLREQLRAIQKELGQSEDASNDLSNLRELIEKARLPEEASKHALKELSRLERMPESAAEYSMVRTYLEVMSELPWSVSTTDEIDIAAARQILDEDHYGLEKVKKLIVEYLAVYKLKPDGKRPNLCLVGPPGVGKTSLGHSIARAMGKEFVRVSLGGVHDESEVRGHRRTYIGALPGNIVQGMRKAGSNNPVFMLDEMDKLGQGMHGDPSAALLEVLDPEQNSTFRDNYLAVPFNLSKVLFIGTANVLSQIPRPLQDRFEVIELPGYTAQEKLEIAKRYLVKRQLEATGLKASQCKIKPQALREIITKYTREAGVRGLERNIGRICRSVGTRIASDEVKSVTIGADDLVPILGIPRYENEIVDRTRVPGVAVGLAWTPFGGEILFIEATAMPGGGKLMLTGQLGDVMRESAQAAHSLLRTRAEELGIGDETLAKRDIHVHLPAGAIPKDGPSAGVALFLSLVSLFKEKPLRSDLAVTGEVSLRGKVLPVGGIKEKVLGAMAAGIKTVMMPKRNEHDLDDVPDEVKQKLEFVFLDTVEDALAVAFHKPARKKVTRKKSAKAKKKTRKTSSRNSAPRAAKGRKKTTRRTR